MAKQTSADKLRFLIQQFIRKFGLLEETSTPCGMPLSVSKAHALMELLDSADITQNELACRLSLSKSNTSRMVAKLLSKGHVQKTRDRHDGRAFRIRLTIKGRRLAKEVSHKSRKHFAELSKRLPPGKTNKIIDALAVLIEATQRR